MDLEPFYTPEEFATFTAAKNELKKTKASLTPEFVAASKAMTVALEDYARAKTKHSAVEAKIHEAHVKFDTAVGPINSWAFLRKQEAETGLSFDRIMLRKHKEETPDERLATRIKALGGVVAVLEMLES